MHDSCGFRIFLRPSCCMEGMYTCQFCAPHRSWVETHVGSKHRPHLPIDHVQAIGHSPWQFLVQCFSSTVRGLFEGVECNSIGTRMRQSPTLLCRGGHGVHRSHAWFCWNWQQPFPPSCQRDTIQYMSLRLPPPLRMRPVRTRLPWSVPSLPSSSLRQVVRSFLSPQAAISPAGSFPATRTCGSVASWPPTRSDSWGRPAPPPSTIEILSPVPLPKNPSKKGIRPVPSLSRVLFVTFFFTFGWGGRWRSDLSLSTTPSPRCDSWQVGRGWSCDGRKPGGECDGTCTKDRVPAGVCFGGGG